MISGFLVVAIAQVIAEPVIPFRIEELPDRGFVFIVDKYLKSQEDLIDQAFRQASQTRCLPRQVYAGSFTSRTKPTADGKDEVVTNLRHPFYCTNPTVLQMRSEEQTFELQSLMRISYAVFCLKKTKQNNIQ